MMKKKIPEDVKEKDKIMKNNDKNVKSFERAKKKKRNVKLENSDTALQCGVFTAIVQREKKHSRGKPEKSMNKNGTESRTYFMLLSINSHFNPPPTPSHLKDECTFVPFYSLAVQLFGMASQREGRREKGDGRPTCYRQK